jgi:MarR family
MVRACSGTANWYKRPEWDSLTSRNAEDGTPRKVRAVAQGNLHRIKVARQRMVLCRLMIDIMRSLHGTYAPATEPFGGRLETLFIGLCVALGEIEGRPFSITKIAAYMRVPRTTVMRRLDRLESWGLIYRHGRYYFLQDKALNSLIGMRSYQQIRRLLSKAGEELTVLDSLPD